MKKVILVTLNNYDLPNVKCVKTFRNIEWENVDVLIFHSSTDGDHDIVKELSNLKGKVEEVIYINKNITPLYYCIFTGLDADIYDSEDYLMDESILTYLVDNYKETGMAMKPPSSDLETLAKSIGAISTSSVESLQKLVSNDFWMKTLNTAVAKVDNAIARASQININVVEMLEESSKLIQELEESNATTTSELETLTKLIYENDKRPQRASSPYMFTTYPVPVTVQKVLYIRSYGNCRYLNSFIMAYQHYLKMSRQQSSKILIAIPKLKLHLQRYNDVATRLAQDSIDIVNYHSTDIFITHEPKKSVLDAFFNQSNVQVFIVIDLMFGDELISGHMVRTINAISGSTDIQKFNLDARTCISAITAKPEGILIPHISKYSSANEATKRSLYFDKGEKSFKRLDDIIASNRR